MEKPPTPSSLPATPNIASPPPPKENQTQIRKPPTPQELISHYESQGLDSKEASLQVIEDLQAILVRVVSPRNRKKEKFMADTSRKLDNVNTRLAILEMKVDEKPGFSQSFLIGVTSGAVLRGVESVLPHVFGGLGKIWDSVRSSTS